MPKSKNDNTESLSAKTFSRWKVVWPAFLIVASSFIVVILVALGVPVDQLIAH